MISLTHRFGLALRRLREQRHWSQEALAGVAGLNRSYLGEIERGAAVPSLLTLVKLAEAFGLSLTELVASCGL